MTDLAAEELPGSGSALRALPCFKGLTGPECDRVFPALTRRVMRRGTTLILNRELPGCGGFVWSGVYRILLAPATRRPVAIDVARRGDPFGFFHNFERWGDALRFECREAGTLLTMKASAFASLSREAPGLSEAVLLSAAQRAVELGARIFELATLTARERLVAELLRLSRSGEWLGRTCLLRPAPTHQDLAEQVGAAREVVTRALKSLAKDGMIRIGRRRLEVLDVESLLALDERATGRRRDSYFRLRRRGGVQ